VRQVEVGLGEGAREVTSLPSDERRTPRWFFEACDRLWGPYDVDCFAAKWNHQVERYFTKERSFYAWEGFGHRRGWFQPPYSRGQLFRAVGRARELVLGGCLQAASCLVPVDQSTLWWDDHVSRPEGRRRGARWLHLPPLFSSGSHQLISEQLRVTIAPVTKRLAFEMPPGTPARDLAKMHGAKQPSVVVTFERP
jgi:hypothetical protein